MRLLTAALVIALLAPGSALAQQAHPYDDRPKITVNGEAVVNVRPDRILISFGIETWDMDIEVAKQKNNAIQKKAVTAIKECGVPPRDVQTDHLSIEPRYKNQDQREDLIGYFVRNTLVVTLNNPAKVEDLITRVLHAGVNHLQAIDFRTSDFKKHREEARELALRAAREKAEKMAGVLGQSIGPPIQISERDSPWWYYSSWTGWSYGRTAVDSQVATESAQPGADEVLDAIALGKISIRANVTVTFELKK
jgi:uncharacterized protein YggE